MNVKLANYTELSLAPPPPKKKKKKKNVENSYLQSTVISQKMLKWLFTYTVILIINVFSEKGH